MVQHHESILPCLPGRLIVSAVVLSFTSAFDVRGSQLLQAFALSAIKDIFCFSFCAKGEHYLFHLDAHADREPCTDITE